MASNDGYLLQHVVARGVPALGVEPARNVADVARERGIRTENRFLDERVGKDLADRYGQADLVVANNVLAHVPALVDFVRGLRALVANDGMVSIEFPHLQRLIERQQYDTIYHEHYSYFTMRTAMEALALGDLQVVDVAELDTHGGSLRVLTQPSSSAGQPSQQVANVLAAEASAGLHTADGHDGFSRAVLNVKSDLVTFLARAARDGRSVAGYGAPGKGNTLLNHCAIRRDLMPYTVDRSPYKQGLYLPGTHIPVYRPERLAETRPDFIVVLPWNLRDEILEQLAYARDWGARFVIPIPQLEVI